MDSLIHELQRDALNSDVSVSDLLRKAFVAAKKLKIQEFEHWINSELKGYIGQDTPKYRSVAGQLKLLTPHGWQRGRFPEAWIELEKTLSKMPIVYPISEIETIANKHEGAVVIDYPKETEAKIVKWFEFPPAFHCNPASFHRIVESIRNVILNWALELEENGILGEGLAFTPKEKEVASSITYNIEQLIQQGSHSQIRQTEGTQMKIDISNSTLGMFNTGEMKQIESISINISTLANSDQSQQVAEALKKLTEAVTESQDISSEQRTEILEQLELLSEQATLAPPERKSGLIKPTFSALATTLSAFGGLAEIWSTWGTPIKAFFGVGG